MRPPPSDARNRELLVVFLASYTLLGGVLSLCGWVGDSRRLTDWLDLGISVQPNTAVAFTALGGALLALVFSRRSVAKWLGAAATVIGGLTLSEHASGIDLGIDGLLLFDRPWGGTAVVHPGRMGPPAAISFTVLGVAVVFATRPGPSRLRRMVPTLAFFTAGISSISIVGYIYGASTLYTVPTLTAIALQSATFVLAASIAICALEPNMLTRLLQGDSAASSLTRKLLPVIILVPLALGYIRLFGQSAGWYDGNFGSAVRTVVEICLLLIILTATGNAVSKEIRAKDRHLQHVTDNAAIMVAQCGRDLRYKFANKTFARFLGRPLNDILGKPIQEILEPETLTTIEPYIDRVLRGERVEYEAEMAFAGAGRRFVRGEYVPDYDRDGNVTGWIAAITDITERKRIEDALLTADRRKDEFLATLAHELRNPLAPIRTASALMPMQGQLSPEQVRSLEMIDRQVSQMARLLDDLLDVSRITRDRLELRREPVELSSIVHDAIEMSRPLLDSGKHELSVTLPTEPIFLDADEVRLTQVFGNLLNNACKYTPEGGRIGIAMTRRGADAVIEVTDNGMGIPRDKLESVFDMFSQVDPSLERTHGGLGIGLHLVKRIVELHGGRVEAHSDGPGRGARFVVILSEDSAAQTAPRTVAVSPPPIPSRRVLVVDDNADAADSLSTLLEFGGHQTEIARDGFEAIEKARSYRPDVILLDIGLPGLNGYETCRRIREFSEPNSPIIVALTGWGGAADREKSKQAGFDAHLVKPVDAKRLWQLLGLSLERKGSGLNDGFSAFG
jgi:PAS domain S-box-containing protein